MSEARTSEAIGRSVIELLLAEPFYGHLLGSVTRHITDKTQTAAVAVTNDGVQLWVNPDFFLKTIRRGKERTAVIKHEALHLLFKHLFRWDTAKHSTLFNIAADLVVNQFVAPWPLPAGAITLATFPDMELPPDQTMDWYYEQLMSLHQELKDASMSAPDSEATSQSHSHCISIEHPAKIYICH